MTIAFQHHVEAGAALLDKWVPGWAYRIDLNTFCMWEYPDCVLGQLFNSYGEGLRSLLLSTQNKIELSESEEEIFSTQYGFTLEDCSTDYIWDMLQDLWEGEIIERRNSQNISDS